jgi:hypothetical protein
MASPNPANTTVLDLCKAALKDCGYIGIGQTPLKDDIVDAWTRLQWMLQQWERNRWMVFHLVNMGITSTGAQSYSVGPGGDFDTGATSTRPARIESAFLRQLQNSGGNEVDTPLEILQSREDYDKIALKSMVSYPGAVFLDTGWPLATLYCYPVAQAGVYAIHISVMAQLPTVFSSLTATFDLPYEYYTAIVSNLALRLRARYQLGTFPGDELPRLAKSSLDTIKGANTQIGRLTLPNLSGASDDYNIFSDRF